MYIYDANGSCSDEVSFVITITTTPSPDNPSDVDNCGDYTLPALSVGNYFSGSGGTGTAYSAGNTISSSMTLYVYAANGICTAENSFNITISTPITADAGVDQDLCGTPDVTLAGSGSGTWTGGAGIFTPGSVFYDMTLANFGVGFSYDWDDGTTTHTAV